MREVDKSPPNDDDQIKGTKWNTFEVEDGREEKRLWIPRYLRDYAKVIGDRGIAIYYGLAWWCTDDAPHHRPSLREIGEAAGVSRATVWRGLKPLEEVGLIEVVQRIDTTGKRPHKLRLTTPFDRRKAPPDSGTPVAGCSNLSAPSAQSERSERSDCTIGALNLLHPSLDQNQNQNVCVEKPHNTHNSPPPTPENQSPAEKISELWIRCLIGGAPAWREAVQADIPDAVELLLRRGWTEEQLAEAIEDERRDPNEWPRVLVKRLGVPKPQTGRTPRSPLIERQRAKDEAEKAFREREAAGFPSLVDRLAKKIGRAPDSVQDDEKRAAEGGAR